MRGERGLDVLTDACWEAVTWTAPVQLLFRKDFMESASNTPAGMATERSAGLDQKLRRDF